MTQALYISLQTESKNAASTEHSSNTPNKATSETQYLCGACAIVVLVRHLALLPEARHILPPEPWLSLRRRQLEHTQLSQVLLKKPQGPFQN